MLTWEQMEQAKAEGRVREETREEEGYGPFPGGDPRRFTPDPDCSTPEERDRWEKACEEANKGEGLERDAQCRLMGDGAVYTRKGFGLGTYKAMIHYYIVKGEDGEETEYF